MIARKPKLTEEQFLRGKTGAQSNGFGPALKRINFRMDAALFERLRARAYENQTNMNTLVVEILAAALDAKPAKHGNRKS